MRASWADRKLSFTSLWSTQAMAFDDRVFDDVYASKLDMSKHSPVRTYALSSKTPTCVALSLKAPVSFTGRDSHGLQGNRGALANGSDSFFQVVHTYIYIYIYIYICICTTITHNLCICHNVLYVECITPPPDKGRPSNVSTRGFQLREFLPNFCRSHANWNRFGSTCTWNKCFSQEACLFSKLYVCSRTIELQKHRKITTRNTYTHAHTCIYLCVSPKQPRRSPTRAPDNQFRTNVILTNIY